MEQTTDVVVTGLALITALGSSASVTWRKLMAGESAIALRQPFLDLVPGPLAMQGKRPLDLDDMTQALVQAAWRDAVYPTGRQAYDCAQPSGNQPGAGVDCGVVIGSSRSYLRTWEAMACEQRQGQSIQGDFQGDFQGDWLAALPHGPALMAARSVGSLGPLLAPMAACATGLWAIAQAADLIRQGHCSRVVAGAVESPITPLTLTGFRKMGALATTGCYPFDRRREGFVLGEGGAVLVLESAALAKQRGARIYGKILAAGLTNDSHHVSSFDPSYAMGRRALSQCLQRSGLSPEAIDAVHLHGTSTVQNDRMEASLIAQMLGRQVPVMASKGATGHTLGASGALGVALSLLSLQRQAWLPCVGLQEPGFDLNFVCQGRKVGAHEKLEHMLCFSFGFGGQNAVLALRRWA